MTTKTFTKMHRIMSACQRSLWIVVMVLHLSSCLSSQVDRDADQDGVQTKSDKCPDTPAGVAVDPNGCPLDGDQDGIADSQDRCPAEAGTPALQGCPDRDQDGVADGADPCPDQLGVAALKGCPDADGDGVADGKDNCPNTPRGTQIDANGCSLDSDKDGVSDYEDRCPNRAGPASNRGCPETKVEAMKRLQEGAQYILFEPNKALLRPSSYSVLAAVAQMLNDYPDYSLSIAGHADNTEGSSYHCLRLSEARATVTRRYFLAQGIEASRLDVLGYGKTKPITSNASSDGRALNRRVDLDVFLTGEPNAAEMQYGPPPVMDPEPAQRLPTKPTYSTSENQASGGRYISHSTLRAAATQPSGTNPTTACFRPATASYTGPRAMQVGNTENVAFEIVAGLVDSLQRLGNRALHPRLHTPITARVLLAHSTQTVAGDNADDNITTELDSLQIGTVVEVLLKTDTTFFHVTPMLSRSINEVTNQEIKHLLWTIRPLKAGERIPLNFVITTYCSGADKDTYKRDTKTIRITVTDPLTFRGFMDLLQKYWPILVAVVPVVFGWLKRVRIRQLMIGFKPETKPPGDSV